MANSGRNASILAMVATAMLWSLAGLFIKIIDWNPIAIAGTRSIIASVVIFAYLKHPKITFSFPQIGAAFANAATMLLFVSANKTTSSANAILLQYVGPVFTVFLGAMILKERPRVENIIALPLVIAGMIVMFFDKLGGGKLFGDTLAIISALTFSFYYIFMRMQKDGSPLESILLSHWITAGFCLILSIFFPMPHVTWASFGAVLILGLVQVGISAILFAFAIKRITAIQANIIAVIEPVFNPIWVFIALKEIPGPNTCIGGGIILLAVTISTVISAHRRLNSRS
jgi:drug/metabolite transporter (DMT)-like permease